VTDSGTSDDPIGRKKIAHIVTIIFTHIQEVFLVGLWPCRCVSCWFEVPQSPKPLKSLFQNHGNTSSSLTDSGTSDDPIGRKKTTYRQDYIYTYTGSVSGCFFDCVDAFLSTVQDRHFAPLHVLLDDT
jgi:hypothetical protein